MLILMSQEFFSQVELNRCLEFFVTVDSDEPVAIII